VGSDTILETHDFGTEFEGLVAVGGRLERLGPGRFFPLLLSNAQKERHIVPGKTDLL
jgi:hypothetical protein